MGYTVYIYVNVYLMTYGYTMNSMTVCDTIWTCKLIMILYGYLSWIQYRDTNFMGTFYGIYIYIHIYIMNNLICGCVWNRGYLHMAIKMGRVSPSLDNTTEFLMTTVRQTRLEYFQSQFGVYHFVHPKIWDDVKYKPQIVDGGGIPLSLSCWLVFQMAK